MQCCVTKSRKSRKDNSCISRYVVHCKLLTFLLLILIDNISASYLKKKEIPFPNHVTNYEDTLIWVVKVKPDTSQESPLTFSNHGYSDDNTNEYKDNIPKSDIIAKKIANELDLLYLGSFHSLKDFHMLGCNLNFMKNKTTMMANSEIHFSKLHKLHKRSLNSAMFAQLGQEVETSLEGHACVIVYSRQRIISRQKRSIKFSDPFYSRQWHLHNQRTHNMDINVTGVWERQVNGSGITVAVVDDGVEWTNKDIHDNYNPNGSYDLNSDDPDPMPNGNKASNHHGTRCAGEIAAVPNNICSVGVAYGAKVSGIRVLDGPMTDSLEASAFNKYLQVNDIYSCSWGPDDDGKTVDGPHILAAAAMQYGINFGRHGYGSIYVVASGNGGRFGDNCNYDGYANSIYTVTIGAVDETGHMPFYSEECASMLAVTFSSGSMKRSIVTTDWTKHGGNGCTESHSGTSAAAPIAAGMIALMLQVRPCLTWRDVQYLIVMTAQKVDIDVAHWQKNGAGLYHSHKHGFGLMKAWRLVNAAKIWEMVPWVTSYSHKSGKIDATITKGQNNPLLIRYKLTEEVIAGYDLFIMEYIQLTVTITHPCRGMLEIILKCPSGTKSLIGSTRSHDNSSTGFSDWTFSTVRCWGESPVGTWKITVKDTDTGMYGFGYLKQWKLKIFGTPMTLEQFQQRRDLIEEAMSGKYLNQSYNLPCPPPPVVAKPDTPMSQRTLKLLALASVFCLVMALYETMEYLLCYNDEKKEQRRRMGLNKQARHMSQHRNNEDGNPSESVGLLEMEEIPLDDYTSTNENGENLRQSFLLDEIENDEETVEFDLGTSYVAAKDTNKPHHFISQVHVLNNSGHSKNSENFETDHNVSDSFLDTDYTESSRTSNKDDIAVTHGRIPDPSRNINIEPDVRQTLNQFSHNTSQSHSSCVSRIPLNCDISNTSSSTELTRQDASVNALSLSNRTKNS